jgi:hypothetical protein
LLYLGFPNPQRQKSPADLEVSDTAFLETHCFAAALAQRENAELFTGDPEFKAVEKEIKIGWLK